MQGKTGLLDRLSEGGKPYFIIVEGSESDTQSWNKVLGVDYYDLFNVLKEARAAVMRVIVETLTVNTIYLFNLAAIKDELNGLAARVSEKHPGQGIVSLSGVYCDQSDGQLEINRLIDLHNQSYRNAGPRPNHKAVDSQINELKEATGKNSFILVDDVCFDGKTARTLLEMGLTVSDIVGGVVTEKAVRRLTKRRQIIQDDVGSRQVVYQKPIRLHTLIRVGQDGDNFVDTLPVHDFIPFAPLSGKTVGIPAGGQTNPLVVDGVSFSKPYLLPYVDSRTFEDLSSIPADRALAFSVTMLKIAIDLFRGLEDLVGRPITPSSLAYQNPRFSYPVPSEGGHHIRLGESVVKILEEHLNILQGAE
jgi:hypothetical protein